MQTSPGPVLEFEVRVAYAISRRHPIPSLLGIRTAAGHVDGLPTKAGSELGHHPGLAYRNLSLGCCSSRFTLTAAESLRSVYFGVRASRLCFGVGLGAR